MTTLSIRIDRSLRGDLKSISKSEKKAMSAVVRDSLRRYVALQKFRAVRRKILPLAEARGIRTDEDVFRALK